jgi:hypothetical protein
MPTQPRPQVVIPLSDEPCTDGSRCAPEVAARRLAGDPQLADPLTRRSGSTEPNRDANRANDGLAVELRPVGQLLLREVPALGAQRGCGWRCAPQRGQIHALPAPAHTLRVVAGRVALRL